VSEADKTVKLSEKEQASRDFILNGPMFKVILKIGFPIAFFQLLNAVFWIFDSFMASSIDATSVSAVVYFTQVNLIIGGLTGGLTTGAAIKISQAYGKGEYGLVKKRISSLFAFGVVVCLILFAIIVPTAIPILRLINTPEEFITYGWNFFLIGFINTSVGFMNGIYTALEAIQGNSKRIMKINLIATCLRAAFTAFSVYVLQLGLTSIAISALLAQLFIMSCGWYNLRGKSDVFTISFADISFKGALLWPMISISIPIMIERSLFHIGKTVVNVMVTSYGPLVVGALGLSNIMCFFSMAPQIGFQDATIAVMSQNAGAKRFDRVIGAFKAALALIFMQSVLFFIPSFLFAYQLTWFFAMDDPLFHYTIFSIFRFDVLSLVPLGIFAAVTAFLLGLGYTKVTLLLNICRLFIFRIPVLWLLQNFTNMGDYAVGMMMSFSNIGVSVLGAIVCGYYIFKLCKKEEISFFKINANQAIRS